MYIRDGIRYHQYSLLKKIYSYLYSVSELSKKNVYKGCRLK